MPSPPGTLVSDRQHKANTDPTSQRQHRDSKISLLVEWRPACVDVRTLNAAHNTHLNHTISLMVLWLLLYAYDYACMLRDKGIRAPALQQHLKGGTRVIYSLAISRALNKTFNPEVRFAAMMLLPLLLLHPATTHLVFGYRRKFALARARLHLGKSIARATATTKAHHNQQHYYYYIMLQAAARQERRWHEATKCAFERAGTLCETHLQCASNKRACASNE